MFGQTKNFKFVLYVSPLFLKKAVEIDSLWYCVIFNDTI